MPKPDRKNREKPIFLVGAEYSRSEAQSKYRCVFYLCALYVDFIDLFRVFNGFQDIGDFAGCMSPQIGLGLL